VHTPLLSRLSIGRTPTLSRCGASTRAGPSGGVPSNGLGTLSPSSPPLHCHPAAASPLSSHVSHPGPSRLPFTALSNLNPLPLSSPPPSPSSAPSITSPSAASNGSLTRSSNLTGPHARPPHLPPPLSPLLSPPLHLSLPPRSSLVVCSGSKKRFRFTRNGLILRWRAGKSHKAWTKSSSRLRRLSRPVTVYHGHVKMIKRSLPYGWKHSR
jgi:ribosomal protein L35